MSICTQNLKRCSCDIARPLDIIAESSNILHMQYFRLFNPSKHVIQPIWIKGVRYMEYRFFRKRGVLISSTSPGVQQGEGEVFYFIKYE